MTLMNSRNIHACICTYGLTYISIHALLELGVHKRCNSTLGDGRNKKERRVEPHQKWKGKFGFEAAYRKLIGSSVITSSMANMVRKYVTLWKVKSCSWEKVLQSEKDLIIQLVHQSIHYGLWCFVKSCVKIEDLMSIVIKSMYHRLWLISSCF